MQSLPLKGNSMTAPDALCTISRVAAGCWRQGPAPLPQSAAVRVILEALRVAVATGYSQGALAEVVLLSGGEDAERNRVSSELCAAIGPECAAKLLRAAGAAFDINQ